MHDLIQCADHSFAPWSCVCNHLFNGSSHDWRPVSREEGTEVENDWVCKACQARLPELTAEDFRAVCIHCVRKMQAKSKQHRERR
jgi:hypothetical protein